MKRALIIGIAGQDGSYLSEHLLEAGCEVHGTCRPGEEGDPASLWRLAPILDRLILHPVSLEDSSSLRRLVLGLAPEECYHLAGTRKAVDGANSAVLLEGAIATSHTLAEALSHVPQAGLLFAASSEMFGPEAPAPQDERTTFDPRSLYAIAKVAGVQLMRYYREHHGLRACSAILFNHESPRRGTEFVTRRITQGAARIRLGLQSGLELGDLDARRDWGHARSFAKGMWMMLQQESPQDLVLATGHTHSVREFLEAAFDRLGLDPYAHITVDPALVRLQPGQLRGDPSRAASLLGWKDEVPFASLVAEMVDADLARSQAGVAANPFECSGI